MRGGEGLGGSGCWMQQATLHQPLRLSHEAAPAWHLESRHEGRRDTALLSQIYAPLPGHKPVPLVS